MQGEKSHTPSFIHKYRADDQRDGRSFRVIDAERVRPIFDGAELWHYREVVFFLIWRSFKVKYRQTYLGILWAVLKPLIGMGVFTVIFDRMIGVPSDGVPYPLFVLCGLIPWNFASRSINSATGCLIGDQELLKHVYFPRIAIPMAVVVAGLGDMMFGWTIFAAALIVFGTVPPLNSVLVPVFLLLMIAAVFGIGLMTSALNVRFRDIGYLVPFAITTALFMTPVVYPASLVPDAWQAVYALNPMVGIIGGFRWCLLDVPLDLTTTVISSICAIALLVGGLFLFSRGENTFSDYI